MSVFFICIYLLFFYVIFVYKVQECEVFFEWNNTKATALSNTWYTLAHNNGTLDLSISDARSLVLIFGFEQCETALQVKLPKY